MLILLLWLAVSLPASAYEIALLEFHNQDGTLVQLEPGGRYAHAAIRYRGQWLHAHTHRGVDLVSDEELEEYGHRIVFLSDGQSTEPSPSDVARWMGKPFDRNFSATNPSATYCSRLIGELLNIPPQPMRFLADHWKLHSAPAIGEPGWSPDKLARALKERGFYEVKPCAHLLESVSAQHPTL